MHNAADLILVFFVCLVKGIACQFAFMYHSASSVCEQSLLHSRVYWFTYLSWTFSYIYIAHILANFGCAHVLIWHDCMCVLEYITHLRWPLWSLFPCALLFTVFHLFFSVPLSLSFTGMRWSRSRQLCRNNWMMQLNVQRNNRPPWDPLHWCVKLYKYNRLKC